VATNGLCSLVQAKLVLGITNPNDTNDDPYLDICIGAASRDIEGMVGYKFWVDAAVATREFYADDYRTLYVDDGISTTTGLVVALDTDDDGTFETTLTLGTDFLLRPTNALDMVPVRPWTEVVLAANYTWPMYISGRPGAQITAKFGWPEVPADITLACMLHTKDLFKAKDSPGGSPEFSPIGASGVSPMVRNLLKPYTKVSVG
jgi:hypothetical protein